MFATSDRFKEVIRDTSEQYLMGIITTNDGATHEINDSVISNGSVSISKQAMTKQELSFGGAILGELDISIRTEASRYLFYGAEIDLWCCVVVDGVTEYVPFGIWTIAEADRDKKALKMVAYDKLIKFDKKYDLALEGTPYELMSAFARECGCELAEDEAYYMLLTNGTEHITINEEAGCSNYRDAASIVAQMCGCFVQADRYGRITMRQFSTTPTFSLTKGQRYSSKISDFVCHYIELEVTGMAGTFVSIDSEFDVGMKMTIENSPAWDYGLEEVLQARVDNLRTFLGQISYTPSEVTIPSDPSIDCGDMITLYTDDGGVNTIVTSYVWKYHGVMRVESDGVNPYLQTSDAANSRQLQSLKQEIDAAKVIYYPFKNTADVKLGTELQKVASVVFTTIADTSIVFQGTFQVNVEVEDIEESQTISVTVPTIEQGEEIIIPVTEPGGGVGEFVTVNKTVYNYNIGEKVLKFPIKCHKRDFANLRIHYSYDNIDQKIEYVGSLNQGGHVISLYYPVNKVAIDTTHTFEIWMSVDNGNASIDAGMFIGAVSGQGLAATSQWNGLIEVEDFIERIQRNTVIEVRPLQESALTLVPNTNKRANVFSDAIARFTRNRIGMRGMSDSFGGDDIKNPLDIIVRQQTVQFGLTEYTIYDGDVLRTKTKYRFTGVQENIDEGNAFAVQTITSDKKSIESVVEEE